MSRAPLLVLEDIRRSFPGPRGPRDVLRGVNLRVAEGDFIALTGPSGSGKTTLLNLCALLDVPSGGRLWWSGREVSLASEAERCRLRGRELGMVFQNYHLLGRRTVWENVAFRFRYAPRSRSEIAAAVERALAAVELADLADQPARLLSGGEQQRVAIARALAGNPRLLLADEPTGNLDGDTARQIMQCFQRLHRNGLAILWVTHDATLLDYASRRLRCIDGCLSREAVS